MPRRTALRSQFDQDAQDKAAVDDLFGPPTKADQQEFRRRARVSERTARAEYEADEVEKADAERSDKKKAGAKTARKKKRRKAATKRKAQARRSVRRGRAHARGATRAVGSPTATVSQLLALSIGLVLMYLLLTRAEKAARIVAGASAAIEWLGSPTGIVNFRE